MPVRPTNRRVHKVLDADVRRGLGQCDALSHLGIGTTRPALDRKHAPGALECGVDRRPILQIAPHELDTLPRERERSGLLGISYEGADAPSIGEKVPSDTSSLSTGRARYEDDPVGDYDHSTGSLPPGTHYYAYTRRLARGVVVTRWRWRARSRILCS